MTAAFNSISVCCIGSRPRYGTLVRGASMRCFWFISSNTLHHARKSISAILQKIPAELDELSLGDTSSSALLSISLSELLAKQELVELLSSLCLASSLLT
jgi:hypothetical protein